MVAYRENLYHLASREIGRDLEACGDAWDMVQETCLEALRDIDQFQGTTQREFLNWLRRILIHNVQSFARRRRLLASRIVSADTETIDLARHTASRETMCPRNAVMQTEQAQRLHEMLARLPDRDRLSVLMRSRDDRTFREIGEYLGCSAVAARKLWLRVLEKLRRAMEAS
jgi:RNA polymerase sigma-70 factor (ECF subfamily)